MAVESQTIHEEVFTVIQIAESTICVLINLIKIRINDKKEVPLRVMQRKVECMFPIKYAGFGRKRSN